MWNHWAARAAHSHRPFENGEDAHYAWERLRALFPNALAAVLMPNHLHLILPKGKRDLGKLRGILGAVSKRKKIRALWQSITPPAEIPDRHHLRRQIRYVALNPCRAGLCEDPLSWTWSTYRDVHGASAYPWVTVANLTAALDERRSGFEVRFHAYVSGDPSVAVQGTPLPKATAARELAEESIAEIFGRLGSGTQSPREHGQTPKRTSTALHPHGGTPRVVADGSSRADLWHHPSSGAARQAERTSAWHCGGFSLPG